MATDLNSDYLLGSTNEEHDRLIRQAAILDPFTERFFRDAGIGPGHRVLDIGSGLGDVAILVARLVGPTGTVLGVDCDASTLAKAKARVAEAGLRNVIFRESDVGQVAEDEPFDAIVGRLILEFLPNPGAVVSSLFRSLRPSGVMAIQDACWGPFLQLASNLPLHSECASLIYRAFQSCGANMDMERVLYRTFVESGFGAPKMRVDIPIGSDPVFTRWTYDLVRSLRRRMQQHDLPFEKLGDFETLLRRLEAERLDEKTFSACVGLVGAWGRKPSEA
jgi:ubiquinone/menaquinone biosynthesis C-methylase UbiE